MSTYFDFAVATIFAREVLEGAIIIGEYRTIIIRGDSLKAGISREDALREVTIASLFATAFALLVIAAVAIPLAVLAMSFDPTTAKIIEGVSKIVAAISLLQLSLKLPKWLGLYGSSKKKKKLKNNMHAEAAVDEEQAEGGVSDTRNTSFEKEEEEEDGGGGLTLRSIRFNVAWNIWREVAECGVFLIPFFLSGEDLASIPISAVVGFVVGFLLGIGIYYMNKRFKNKAGLTTFAVLLLVMLSAGLFTGGAHNLEVALGSTPQVWHLDGDFWSVDRLPMTILKPFGYNDTRTVLGIVCYWLFIGLAALLHIRKYLISPKIPEALGRTTAEAQPPQERRLSDRSNSSEEFDTVEMGDSSLEGDGLSQSGSFVDGCSTADDTANECEITEQKKLSSFEGDDAPTESTTFCNMDEQAQTLVTL